ncbi:MAG: hypothetical protein JWR24_1915 [Actinoallomurus sp.]|jgi:hypothetical protein|nr:hypothetical protein [Actinoallomurus sp.]
MDDHGRLPPGVDELFADGGTGRALSVTLPNGSVVWPDPGYPQHQPAKRAAFWISDAPVPAELWTRLRAEHRTSGLWPVLLEDSAQPWSAGQIAPEPVAEIGDYEAAAFMAEVWSDWEIPPVDLTPFGRYCPGPAPPGDPMEDPSAAADRCAELLTGRPLGLVPVERGADALAAIGWQGARHHNPWTAPLAAVVRSWEERFGARVVGIGFNTLDLSVAAPPATLRHALHVAAEHSTFCPETIIQGPGTLAGYAEQIRGSHSWSFWWE